MEAEKNKPKVNKESLKRSINAKKAIINSKKIVKK